MSATHTATTAASTDTNGMVTVDQVIQSNAPNGQEVTPELVPFARLLSGISFTAVDNSGSTGGMPLRVAKAFVDAIGANSISLWNSLCDAPVGPEMVRWTSTGGTSPHTIFEPRNNVPANATCFIFMTDGMVSSTTQLARHASVTAHLPSLLVLFGSRPNPRALVQGYNVSVVMAHFTAARTAAVVVINDENDPSAYLVAAKGDWEQALPNCPPLDDTLLLGECPRISIQELISLPSQTHQPMESGTLVLADNRTLQLDLLLRLEDGRGLQLSQSELEDIARAFLTRGQLPAWRQRLNQWLVMVNQEASEQAEQATQRPSSGLHALLRRLRNSDSASERDTLRVEIQHAIHNEATRIQETEAQASRNARGPRALINEALATITALEQTGMNATSLGRLSNRAVRANTVDPNSLASLASLNAEGAPETEDLVMHDIGPVALCLRAMDQPDHNTGDEALNQALRVGQFPENAVFEPTIVSLAISDRIEEMDYSPLTRRRLSVCLPIVALGNEANRRAILQRLCLVFMDGLEMQHTWLIALSSILRTIEFESWADPETTETGRLLNWFAGQIMQHVVLAAGSRLSPTSTQPINEALVSILQDDILLVHSSVEETSVILRLLHRFRGPATFSTETLCRSMQARIAAAVPQTHRNWLQANSASPWEDQGPGSLAALFSSVYQTRIDGTGAHVPMAGTGRVVESLEGLLSGSTVQAIAIFAQRAGVKVGDLVVPGMTLVVLATLDRVSSPHVSSSAAVNAVRSTNPATTAEMSPVTVGTATRQEVLDQVRRRMAWARSPLCPLSPFTTPFGPSVFFFYCIDGTIINMLDGFTAMEGEMKEDCEDFIFRLTEHVRATRGQLMARFYGTKETGAFTDRTIVTPMYREMADEHRATDPSVDLSLPGEGQAFICAVVRRIVGRSGISAGNVHSMSMERNVALLLPSLLGSVAVHARRGLDSRAEPRPLPLSRRVELELQSRSLFEVKSSNPPNPVWTVRDDPGLLQTLVSVQQEQERARVAALRRRLTRGLDAANDLLTNVAEGATQELRQSDLAPFQRAVTWYLRHGADVNVIRPDGYVPIQVVLDLVAVDRFAGATVDQVLEVAEKDEKDRFSVVDESGVLHIRANQGHTITVIDPEQLMIPIQNGADVPVCLHGTFRDAWQNILRSGGLNRMDRQAIQMAVGMPDDPDVRSGIRNSVDIVIHIDVERAMRVHGLRFFRSDNNVICCPGPIPVDCFSSVVDLSDGSLVEF